MPKQKVPEKIAWVLAGGGARGSFQVGVMQSLLKRKHMPNVIVGTSVGALNGAGLCFNDMDVLTATWNKIKKRSDIFSMNLNPFAGGIFNGKPLRKLIKQLTATNPRRDMECIVSYTDLNSGGVRYSSSLVGGVAAFRTAVEASATIPVLVQPVLNRYVDGGVRENCPLRYAIQRGCKKIVVVLCSSVDPVSMDQSWSRKKDIAIRSFDIIAHEMILNDVNTCFMKNKIHGKYKNIQIMLIQPPRAYNRGTLDFSKEAIEEGLYYGQNWHRFGEDRWRVV